MGLFDAWLHMLQGFFQNYFDPVFRLFIETEYKFTISVTKTT